MASNRNAPDTSFNEPEHNRIFYDRLMSIRPAAAVQAAAPAFLSNHHHGAPAAPGNTGGPRPAAATTINAVPIPHGSIVPAVTNAALTPLPAFPTAYYAPGLITPANTSAGVPTPVLTATRTSIVPTGGLQHPRHQQQNNVSNSSVPNILSSAPVPQGQNKKKDDQQLSLLDIEKQTYMLRAVAKASNTSTAATRTTAGSSSSLPLYFDVGGLRQGQQIDLITGTRPGSNTLLQSILGGNNEKVHSCSFEQQETQKIAVSNSGSTAIHNGKTKQVLDSAAPVPSQDSTMKEVSGSAAGPTRKKNNIGKSSSISPLKRKSPNSHEQGRSHKKLKDSDPIYDLAMKNLLDSGSPGGRDDLMAHNTLLSMVLSNTSKVHDESIGADSLLGGSFMKSVVENKPDIMELLVYESNADDKNMIRKHLLKYLKKFEPPHNFRNSASSNDDGSLVGHGKGECYGKEKNNLSKNVINNFTSVADEREVAGDGAANPIILNDGSRPALLASTINQNCTEDDNYYLKETTMEMKATMSSVPRGITNEGTSYSVTEKDLKLFAEMICNERKKITSETIRKSVQLAYVEVRHRHDRIVTSICKQQKNIAMMQFPQAPTLLPISASDYAAKIEELTKRHNVAKAAEISNLKKEYESRIMTLKKEHEFTLARLVQTQKNTEKEFKRELETQKVRHSRMLDNCLLASSNALRVMRKKVASDMM